MPGTTPSPVHWSARAKPLIPCRQPQKTGVIVTASLDGSVFVSSIALVVPAAGTSGMLRDAPNGDAPQDAKAAKGKAGNNSGFIGHLLLSNAFPHESMYPVLSEAVRAQLRASQLQEIEAEETLNRRRAIWVRPPPSPPNPRPDSEAGT